MLGGVLLVGLHLLAEFGALEMLRFPTFTTAILDQFEVAFDSSSGSVLALVLIGLAVTLLTLDLLARGRTRHVRVGTGAARRPPRARLGRTTPLALAAVGTLAVLAARRPGVEHPHLAVARRRGGRAGEHRPRPRRPPSSSAWPRPW